jgi:DUF917 family protein
MNFNWNHCHKSVVDIDEDGHTYPPYKMLHFFFAVVSTYYLTNINTVTNHVLVSSQLVPGGDMPDAWRIFPVNLCTNMSDA